MKKFLFGILGLLFAIPAVADLDPCRNLFDYNSLIISKLNDDGTITDNVSNMFVTPFIPVQPNTTYTLSYNSGSYAQYRRIAGYNAKTTESFTELIKKISKNDGGQEDTYVTQQFITGNNTNYIIFSSFITDTNIQLEEGSTATAYVPFCANQIKIATTAYNAARFSPVVTDLNDTIATIRDVVTNTINQTKAIADLQATKQTRPDENCPAGKKCLLVEDNDGTPHWYEIIESASRLPDGYIERQYIYMMEGSYLLTDIVPTYDSRVEMDFQTTTLPSGSVYLLGGRTVTYGGIFFAQGGAGVCLVDAFGTSSGDRYISSVSLSNVTRYKFTFNNKVASLESGGTTLFTNTSTGTLANGAALVINGLNSNGTVSGAQAGIYLYSFKVWNAQGELVMDLVPAVQEGAVTVVGFYDTVSGTFKTATAGTFDAGPVVQ